MKINYKTGDRVIRTNVKPFGLNRPYNLGTVFVKNNKVWVKWDNDMSFPYTEANLNKLHLLTKLARLFYCETQENNK